MYREDLPEVEAGSYVFYQSYLRLMRHLTPAEELNVRRAIDGYCFDTEMPDLTERELDVLMAMRPQLDANVRKRKASKRGGDVTRDRSGKSARANRSAEESVSATVRAVASTAAPRVLTGPPAAPQMPSAVFADVVAGGDVVPVLAGQRITDADMRVRVAQDAELNSPHAEDDEVLQAVNGEVLQAVNGEVLQAVNGEVPQAVKREVLQAVNGEVPQAVNGEVPQAVNGEVPHAVNAESLPKNAGANVNVNANANANDNANVNVNANANANATTPPAPLEDEGECCASAAGAERAGEVGSGEKTASVAAVTGAASSKPKRKRKTVLSAEQQQRFDRFWTAYPRKTNKQEAVTVWSRLNPDDSLTGVMLDAIQAYKDAEGIWEDVRYIPHPSTWLNGERWNDEVPQPAGTADADAAQQNPELQERFDRFWAAYPRKEGQQGALQAFAQQNPDDALVGTMVRAIQTSLAAPGVWEETRFIPYPEKWLREERWKDEVSAVGTTGQKGDVNGNGGERDRYEKFRNGHQVSYEDWKAGFPQGRPEPAGQNGVGAPIMYDGLEYDGYDYADAMY